ncbi:MAG TPA: aryl-sulfate sulfotransferase [Myxococcota bacterium]|nr:aryl-sulfate sulfotransferase [Myxococcota bacterium]
MSSPRLLAALLLAPTPALAGVQGLTLTSSAGTNPPVGARVELTAQATSTLGLPLQFQLEVSENAGVSWRMVRPYDDAASLVWVPVDQQTYRWRARAREVGGGSALYDLNVTAASRGSQVVVTHATTADGSGHPLVAHYTAPPGACGTGSFLRVELRPTGSGAAWDTTPYKPCQTGRGVNVLVAGMRENTTYDLRYVRKTGGSTYPSSVVTFAAGDAPMGGGAITGSTSASEDVLFGLMIPDPDGAVPVNDTSSPPYTIPMATDTQGNVIWYDAGYADDPTTVVTGLTYEHTALLLSADALYAQQVLREVDLAGNVVREVHIDHVNEELESWGYGPDATLAFDHDAVRFDLIGAGGITYAKLSEPRLVGGQYLLGDMIVGLDPDLHVVWVWDAFDHIPTSHGPTDLVPAQCGQGSPGCPPIKGYPTLVDWTHGNAIAPAPDGDLLFSMRNQDWVVRIDGATGDLVWALGGTAAGNAAAVGLSWPEGAPPPFFQAWEGGAPLPSQAFAFDHQHGANYQDADHLTLFDNGNTRCQNGAQSGCHSRGEVWLLDEVTMRATRELAADVGAFSPALGMAQQLASGAHHFTVGALFQAIQNRNYPYSLHVEVGTGGTVGWTERVEASSYRSYRLLSMYDVSLWDRTSL